MLAYHLKYTFGNAANSYDGHSVVIYRVPCWEKCIIFGLLVSGFPTIKPTG